eukprot:TRINITY_DN8625_c0_g1_i2.p1 TRINITY_DN8625_c0_g1~~TRINITY_DN8625_c0_g1_i2.p1  ORF type:complete len:640 (+),score=102.91 TRINITY_DN8625_c0_g1_i2:215-2134(+)
MAEEKKLCVMMPTSMARQDELERSLQERVRGMWNGIPSPTSSDSTTSQTSASYFFQRSSSPESSLDMLLKEAVVSGLFPDEAVSIHQAAESGDVHEVERLLDEGVEVESPMNNGDTPLIIAARFGHQLILDSLLRHGANVNATNNYLRTSLHEAASNGRAACCQLLLSEGALPNFQGLHGETPLHLAAGRGHRATVRLLLAHGASHASTTTSDDTPLQVAVDHGHEAVCRILLEHGAAPSVADGHGTTPLHLCAERGLASLTTLLLRAGASVAAKDDEERTPVMLAARHARPEVLRLLLNHAALLPYESVERLLEQVDSSRQTALHLALQGGRCCCHHRLPCGGRGVRQVVELVLKDGASVHRVDKQKNSPLHLAAMAGHHPRSVELLLERGARIDQANRRGCLPVHLAARATALAQPAASPLPLSSDIPRGPSSAVPATPLGEQAKRGALIRTAQLLLDSSHCTAQVLDAVDEGNATAAEAAITAENWEVAELLWYHGAHVSSDDGHRMDAALRLLRTRGENDAQSPACLPGSRCVSKDATCLASPGFQGGEKEEEQHCDQEGGPRWCLANHWKFPRKFREAVRALFLAAAHDANTAQRVPIGLGRLPLEAMLLIVERMRHPVRLWLPYMNKNQVTKP